MVKRIIFILLLLLIFTRSLAAADAAYSKIGLKQKLSNIIELFRQKSATPVFYFSNTLMYQPPKRWVVVVKKPGYVAFSPERRKAFVCRIIISQPQYSKENLETRGVQFSEAMKLLGNDVIAEKFTHINNMDAYDITLSEKPSFNTKLDIKPISRMIFIAHNGKSFFISYYCSNERLYHRYLNKFEESLKGIGF